MKKAAVISHCQKYRYSLSRIWEPEKETVTFICLNPSTADENIDDPTIRRCVNFAKSWGMGGLYMANLFAYRATDPKMMKKAFDPVGPANDEYLLNLASISKIVIAAWGTTGIFKKRDRKVKRLLGEKLHLCLEISKNGHPKHPLYLKKDLVPVSF